MKKILSIILMAAMLVGCIAPALVINAAGEAAVISIPTTADALEGDTEFASDVTLTDIPCDLSYFQLLVFWAADAPVSEVTLKYDETIFDETNTGVGTIYAGGNKNIKNDLSPYGANSASYKGCKVDISVACDEDDNYIPVTAVGKLCELGFVFDDAMEADSTFTYNVALIDACDCDDESVDYDDTLITPTVTFKPDPYIGLYEDPTLFVVPEKTEVDPGSKVKVDVRIDANPGFGGGLYVLVYPNTWSIESDACGRVFVPAHYLPGGYDRSCAENTGYLKDRLASFPDTPIEDTYFTTAYFDTEEVTEVNAGNGILASYIFKVPADAKPGTTADLMLIYDKDGEFMKNNGDGTYTYFVFDVVNAQLTIAGETACEHANTKEVVITPATCTEDGSKNIVCLDCSETIEEGVVIPMLGHDYDAVITKPTCTEGGFTTYTCKREGCGDSYTADETEKLGHDFSNCVSVDWPTCTKDGLDIQYCERCCAENPVVLPKLGHNYVVDEIVAPTCTEQGYTLYVCNRTLETYGGSEDCGDSYKDNYTDKLGHDMKLAAEKVEPTCEDAGTEALYACQREGCTYTEGGETITKLGHDMKLVAEKVEPTCTDNGTEALYACQHEGCAYTEGGETIAKLGHDMKLVAEKVEPTCTDNGTEALYACQREGCAYTEGGETITKLGHDMKLAAAKVEPTCTENGTEELYACQREGCAYTEGGETIAKLGHDMKLVAEKVEPTCTDNGTEELYACQREGCAYTEGGETITKLGHDYDSVVTAPTCTEDGYTTYTCKREGCGDTYKADEVEKLGHDYDAVVTKPTCTDDGYTTYTCKREGCGDSYTADETAKLGHDDGKWVVVSEATAEQAGLKVRYCTRCNAELESAEIPAVIFVTKVSAKEKVASTLLDGENITVTSKANADYVLFAIGKGNGMKVSAENCTITSMGSDFATIKVLHPTNEAFITVTDKNGNFCKYTVTVVYDQTYYRSIGAGYTTETVVEKDGIVTVTAKENRTESSFYFLLPSGATYEASEGLTVVLSDGKVYLKAFRGEATQYTFTITAPNGASRTYTINYVFPGSINILGVSGGSAVNKTGSVDFIDEENTVNVTVSRAKKYATFRFKFESGATTVTPNDDKATTVISNQYTYIKIGVPEEGNTVTTTVKCANEKLNAERDITVNVTFVD